MAGKFGFGVTVENDVTPQLTKIASVVVPDLQWGVRETATALTSEMRRTAPLGRHFSFNGAQLAGGTLRRSLRFLVGDLGAILMGAGYGRFVITGTAAHEIVPRNARALAFWWERMGKRFVGAHVSHPGTQPNDFREKALSLALEGGVISRILDQILGAILDGRAM